MTSKQIEILNTVLGIGLVANIEHLNGRLAVAVPVEDHELTELVEEFMQYDFTNTDETFYIYL
jgi:hypothetical protein